MQPQQSSFSNTFRLSVVNPVPPHSRLSRIRTFEVPLLHLQPNPDSSSESPVKSKNVKTWSGGSPTRGMVFIHKSEVNGMIR